MKWRKNFVIPNTNYNIIDHPVSEFVKSIPLKDGKQVLDLMYFGFENGVLTGYVTPEILQATAEWIKNKVVQDPAWADELHQKCEQNNNDCFLHARKILKIDFKNLTDKELWNTYHKIRTLLGEAHAPAVSTTWFMDSEGEVFSRFLQEELKIYLQQQKITDKVVVVDYFTLLTSPVKPSFAQDEEIEFLQLLKKIQADKKVVKIFIDKDIEEIFNSLPTLIKELIENYYNKWHWTPYGYTGPAYDLYFYLEKIKAMAEQVKNINNIINEELARHHKLKQQQQEIIEKISLPEDLQHLFKIARDIIWLKDFRKYVFWHGHYVIDKINKETARRLNLSLKQVNHVAHHEMKEAVLEKKVNEHILNERIRCSLFLVSGTENKYYWGQEAKEIIDSFDIDEPEVDISAGWQGACACPGKVNGRVKIVNSVDDIGKVETGDIMLSVTTYPALLPAMKKASAIVTEDGGITCHAAIVARELRIPCVVGAKKITELLKDGDKVEVDATEGRVKKL